MELPASRNYISHSPDNLGALKNSLYAPVKVTDANAFRVRVRDRVFALEVDEPCEVQWWPEAGWEYVTEDERSSMRIVDMGFRGRSGLLRPRGEKTEIKGMSSDSTNGQR